MKKRTSAKAKKGMSKGKVAAGVAVSAAIGAGAYYLMGPNSKKNQKKVKVLASKIKKGAMSKAKKYEGDYKQAKKMVTKAVKGAKKEISKRIK